MRVEKQNKKLGALIDLTQIEGGLELKNIIENFDKLDSGIKYQIEVAFQKQFNELSKKYDTVEALLSEGFTKIESEYGEEVKRLSDVIENIKLYSEKNYAKKDDLVISIDNLDEDLKEKIYDLLASSGDTTGYVYDYNGKFRKVKWYMYFVLFAGKIVYLSKVENKSYSSDKTITWEDWYGENYISNDFSDNCIELYQYDKPAEYYQPLFYIPVGANAYDSSLKYYYISKTDGVSYIVWNAENYSADTWETDREGLYIFDEATYENTLIDVLENNSYDKTYVLRNLGAYSDVRKEGEANNKAGSVSFNADSQRFTFDNTALSRYVFKLVKYEY